MENETYKVRTFLEGVAMCGAAQAIALLEPASDIISQRKAYQFLKAIDTKFGGAWEHGEAWVDKQVAAGVLHPVRRGKSKNSPLAYSKVELLKCLTTEQAIKLDIFKGTTL